jgi:hypothetical protein
MRRQLTTEQRAFMLTQNNPLSGENAKLASVHCISKDAGTSGNNLLTIGYHDSTVQRMADFMARMCRRESLSPPARLGMNFLTSRKYAPARHLLTQ